VSWCFSLPGRRQTERPFCAAPEDNELLQTNVRLREIVESRGETRRMRERKITTRALLPTPLLCLDSLLRYARSPAGTALRGLQFFRSRSIGLFPLRPASCSTTARLRRKAARLGAYAQPRFNEALTGEIMKYLLLLAALMTLTAATPVSSSEDDCCGGGSCCPGGGCCLSMTR
jgi:hypothetical protein